MKKLSHAFSIRSCLSVSALESRVLALFLLISSASRKNISTAGLSRFSRFAVSSCWFRENSKKSFAVDNKIFLESVERLAVDFNKAPIPSPADFPCAVAANVQQASNPKSFL